MRCLRLLLALSVVSVAACGGDSSAPGPTGPISADVTHYDYTLDLASRVAHATLTTTVTTAGDCISLPFRDATLDPSTVKLDGVAAKSGTVGGGMLNACGAGYAANTTLTLDVDLTIALKTLDASDVGYSTYKDSDQNDYYYLVSWVNGCDQFGPCDSRPDVFATYTFTVTHPAGFVVRCPGTIDDSDPSVTTCDFTYAGGPTYSTFGLIASTAWTQSDAGMWGDVHVTIYDRAATDIAAAIDPIYHTGFLAFMEGQYGAYPYGSELRVLTSPTYWNGFEHPGNIVLADTLAHQSEGYADDVAHTLDHEMTHMWAGNQTTLSGTYDFAWKESMAEYLPFVYEDMGSAADGQKTAIVWKADASVVTYYPVPDDMPALIDYYGDVYGAGPMIFFRQIETMYSRTAVLAAIKSLLGTPHAISVDDVIAALSTATGEDLTAYGTSWLHGTGKPVWPQFELTFTPGAGSAATSTLTVHQSNQQDGVRGCAFHVGLVGAGSGESTEVLVDTFHNGPDQTLTVPTPAFDVTSTTLDPDNECLVYTPTAAVRIPRRIRAL